MFINYAHRGASAYAPENTISAYDLGIEMGANGIELDLQKTKDNKIVIFCDKIIDQKSNGKGKIEDYTYEELKAMDFGSWLDNKYKNEKIVLFEDFAKKYAKMNLTFAIELKVEGIEKETIRLIRKYFDINKVYITSFIFNTIKEVRKIDKKIKISWLVLDEINSQNINTLISINGNQICPPANKISKEGILLAKKNKLGVRLWGVTTEKLMSDTYTLDIEGMTVNFPDKLHALLSELKI